MPLEEQFLEDIHGTEGADFGKVDAEEGEHHVQQDVALLSGQRKVVQMREIGVEQLMQPGGRFGREVIGVMDRSGGIDALADVELHTGTVSRVIDMETNEMAEPRGEDEVEVGAARLTELEQFDRVVDELPERGIGFHLLDRLVEQFGHVETLCRLARIAHGEGVGREQKVGLLDRENLLSGTALQDHVEHRQGGIEHALTTMTVEARHGHLAGHLAKAFCIDMNELRSVVVGNGTEDDTLRFGS